MHRDVCMRPPGWLTYLQTELLTYLHAAAASVAPREHPEGAAFIHVHGGMLALCATSAQVPERLGRWRDDLGSLDGSSKGKSGPSKGQWVPDSLVRQRDKEVKAQEVRD